VRAPRQTVEHSRWAVTDEARGYLQAGTPEAQLMKAWAPGEAGITLAELKVRARRAPHARARASLRVLRGAAAAELRARGSRAWARPWRTWASSRR
jgi:hypothetical protein